MKEKAAYLGMYVFSLLGALLEFLNSNAAGLSVLVAIAGFSVSLYYKRRADKRADTALRDGKLVELMDNRKDI